MHFHFKNIHLYFQPFKQCVFVLSSCRRTSMCSSRCWTTPCRGRRPSRRRHWRRAARRPHRHPPSRQARTRARATRTRRGKLLRGRRRGPGRVVPVLHMDGFMRQYPGWQGFLTSLNSIQLTYSTQLTQLTRLTHSLTHGSQKRFFYFQNPFVVKICVFLLLFSKGRCAWCEWRAGATRTTRAAATGI